MIQSRGDIPWRTLESAAWIAIYDYDVPLVRFEPGSLLGAIGQQFAVPGKLRRTIRRGVVFGQAFPILRAAGDRHSADVVVRAPRFMLFRDGGEHQEFAIGTEREVILAAE